MSVNQMLAKKVWAVVGANTNPQKFGNMIYNRLKNRGYEVYAVNPMYEMIEGDRCYSNLTALPRLPEVVDIVVSPQRAVPVLEEAAALGIKNIWFQPGTYDDQTLEKAKALGLDTVQHCVLEATEE